MVLLLPQLLLMGQMLSVTFAPTPAPKALEILSKASGRKLECAPALSDEVVLAHLKDAPTDAVLYHLAEALCAKWIEHPGGRLVLTPDPAAERKLDQAKDAAREQDFREGLSYIKKRLSEEPQELDADAVKATSTKLALELKRAEAAQARADHEHMFQSGNADEETAAWRATARIALIIDAKTLLDMPDGAKEVWAENPTPMQHPFPNSSDAILAQYRRELALTKPNASVARIKMAVEREGQVLWLRLSALDAAGKQIDRSLVPLSSYLIWTKLPASQNPRYVPPTKDAPMELPQEAREARIALSSSMAYRNLDHSTMLAKCRPKFLDPVRFEPTQWHEGRDLVMAAEATGKNLIGTVSDSIGGKFFFAGSQRATALTPRPSQVLARHRADLMPASDGWLVVRSTEWRYRSSRSRARAFLAEGVRVGGITVDAAADWVSQSTESNPVYDWMWDYLQVLFSGPGSFNSGWDGRELKLWASLGPDNIAELRRGGTLRLSALSTETQTRIAQGVFWYRWLDDDSADPTDRLPNGIVDGTLTMSVTESTVLHGCSAKDDPNLSLSSFSTENIGRALANGEKFFRTIERWQLGDHRVFVLHITLNPGSLPVTIQLDESLFDPNAQILTSLPNSVLAEIEAARKFAIAHPLPPGEYPPSRPTERKAIPP